MESPEELARKLMDACIDLSAGRTTVRMPLERVVQRAGLSTRSGHTAVKRASKEGWIECDGTLVRLTDAGSGPEVRPP